MANVSQTLNATVPQCYTNLSYEVYRICTYNRPTMIVELCLCCVGLLNTTAIILVFTRPHMRKNSMNVLLAALEIANFITMLTRIPSSVLRIACPSVSTGTPGSVLIEVANTIFKPTIFFANWITLVIGIWRMLLVTWPLKSMTFRSVENAFKIMVPAALASLGYEVYVFFYRYDERSLFTWYDDNSDKCYVLPSFKYESTSKSKCMTTSVAARNGYLITCVVMTVIPCLLSVAVNLWLFTGLITLAVRRRRLQEGQNRPVSISNETQTSLVLVIYLTAHAVCHVCPNLFTLIVYMCPNLSLENTDYFCFLFYQFPAFAYLSIVSLICYCFMPGNFRTTLYELTVVKLKAVSRPSTIRQDRET